MRKISTMQVYAREHKRGNWTLYVAIADVSHYVQPKSALDEEAINRATSVYFPGHVVPMLPEKLSNGLCSLKPKVDRLTMVCEMEISALGEMTSYKFYEAVIHSHGRLTYNEVADIVQPAETDLQQRVQAKQSQRYAELVPHLISLYGLFHALRETREANGAMDFDTTETRIVFGENRKIAEIVPVYRNDAHKLIEECMLRANVAAALLLESAELPALYRVHEGPNPNKLENLRAFLREMGLHMGGGLKPTPRDYQAVAQADCPASRSSSAPNYADSLDDAGGVSARQRRTLRAWLRSVYSLHFSDQALSGSARASRDTPPDP